MSAEEEYSMLMRRSRGFLDTALVQLERGYYDLAGFSLEQALQLYLKALLVRLGAGYPKTHSVRRLLRLLADAEPMLQKVVAEMLEEYALELAALEDIYITSRYVAREFEREEIERLLRVVREVMKRLDAALGGRG